MSGVPCRGCRATSRVVRGGTVNLYDYEPQLKEHVANRRKVSQPQGSKSRLLGFERLREDAA
eukprot:1248212-Prymnesium_polylepis.1